jgi:nucleoside-diphosphate-sugar epimerase
MINTNSKILILGATGFVGRNLAERLYKEGYTNLRNHGFTRKLEGFGESVQGDLRDDKFVEEIMKGVDVVYHCAASTSNAVDTIYAPLLHVTPNVIINALTMEKAYKEGVKKFIFLSSSTIYPESGERAVRETDNIYESIYKTYFPVGWMKRYAEVLCKMYSEILINPMQTVIVRPANLYGPHDKYDLDKCHVTPASIIKVATRLDPIPVWGDGTEIRDLLYIEDFCEALQLIMEKEEVHEIYNVGSNKGYSVNEVIGYLKEIEGLESPIDYVNNKAPMIPTRLIDSYKIFYTLGWEAKTSIKEGLEKTLNWYKSVYLNK